MSRGFPVVLLFFFLANPSLFGKVNLSTTSGESLWPAVGVNSAGEVMVVWTEWSSGQIHYRILRNGQWTAARNAGIVGQIAWSNQLSVDSNGRFHITYADGYSSYSRDIYYSYFTGSSWSTPECVHVSPYNSAWNKMDIDKDDTIHVAWYHSNVPKDAPLSSDAVTKSKKFLANWPAGYENISRSRELESIHPAIAALNGNVYTSWMEGGPPRRIYFCEKLGGSWRAPVQIEYGYYPDMVVDNSGNVHIVFSNWGGNFWYISRMSGKWQSVEAISNGVSPLQFGDIQHKNNVIVAAWIQGTDGNWSVYATGKMVGDRWAIPVKIADAPGGGDGNKHVQVALDDRNCAHFVWEGIGIGGNHDIFYEKYCVDTPKDATFIEVDNSYLSFHTDDSSSNPGPQTFRVRASGAGSINYSISKDKSWIAVSPTQGSSSGEWDTITVNVDASGLNDGTYNGSIKISDPNAYNNPVDVGVTLTIGEGGGGGGGNGVFLEADKANLQFKMEEGANPPAKSFNLRATGGRALNYSVSTNKPWLVTFPEEGTVSTSWTPINVFIEADQMKPGNFKGRIDVTAAGASNKVSVFVDLTIEKSKTPSIQLDRSRFYFWGYAHGDNPPSSSFRIRNSGSQTLQYKISSNKNWLKLTPSQGTSAGEWDTINVTANCSSLEAGKHLANIQITCSQADNSPQRIGVEFEVEMPPQPYPPVGITVKRMNHEGLVFQDYKSKIEWSANPRNNGLFTIVKYYIFRKDKYQHNAPWIFIGEVPANVFVYYDGGFPSKEERNRYNYTVSSVDSGGKESMRPKGMDAYGILQEGSSSQKERMKKDSTDNKKIR